LFDEFFHLFVVELEILSCCLNFFKKRKDLKVFCCDVKFFEILLKVFWSQGNRNAMDEFETQFY